MKIYVGNLSYNTTEDELQKIFEGFGTVISTDIIKDRDTGKNKSFAFIEMKHHEEANTAINDLNGADIGGRNIKVKESIPKSERQ